MDVFAIEKGKALKLSVDEFEKQTCHEYPYYRTKKDKRLSLYAICPECGNPIQIVNMYGEEMMQNVTRKVSSQRRYPQSFGTGRRFSFYFPITLQSRWRR